MASMASASLDSFPYPSSELASRIPVEEGVGGLGASVACHIGIAHGHGSGPRVDPRQAEQVGLLGQVLQQCLFCIEAVLGVLICRDALRGGLQLDGCQEALHALEWL